MLAALDRHLKEHDYKYSTARDRELYQSKLVLEGKVKHLRQRGNWKRPNAASALRSEEENEMLWMAKIPCDSNGHRTSHISRTPRQIKASNSFLGFSVWSFPTSAEQIQQASSHLAVAINNFHSCQVTFSVIQGQRSSPKSLDDY